MANSCSIIAKCKNKNGEVVDSKLFKDLLDYSSNDREYAKKMYVLALNPDFLEKFGERATFDENGELSLKSLLEMSKSPIDQDRLLKKLNKDAGAGTFEWNEAIQKVQSFNRNSQWNKDYIATLEEGKNKTYTVSVVQRTPASETALNETIANQTIQDKIISILAKNGIAVDFLEEGRSQYSTKNAKKTADGLYHLIQVVHGRNTTTEVAEEAGHFAVAALGNSPLVQRLERLLTPEVQKQILGDEYDSKFLGRDSRREVAGDLVGKALVSRLDSSPWGLLANRIATLAKKVFYTISGNEVALARTDAEALANQIAKGLASDNFQGTTEQALETEETLYSTEYSPNVKVYRSLVSELTVTVSRLKAMNSSLAGRFEAILASAQLEREALINENVGAIADSAAIEGIAEAVESLVNLMSEEIPNLLNSVDFNNTLDFATNMMRNGRSLREAHIATKQCIVIADILSKALSVYGDGKLTGFDMIQTLDPNTGRVVTRDLRDLQQSLSRFIQKGVVNGFYEQLMHKEKLFFCKFLEDSYGGKYINRAARVVLKWKSFTSSTEHVAQFKEAEEVSISSLLESMESDISFFEKWLASMSNSGDIIGGIVDKVIKQANKQADDMTNTIQDNLRALEEQMRTKLKVTDPSRYYERDENGALTGNILADRLWGVWEKDYSDFMAEKKKEFLEQVASTDPSFDNRSEIEKAMAWQIYFEPLRKQWHKEHSRFNTDQSRWEPSYEGYTNPQYAGLSTEERQWLGELMEIKQQLDTLINNGMPTYRAPQFKGTFINRVQNAKRNGDSLRKTLWRSITENFVIDVEDAGEFGSAATYNSDDEDMFKNKVALEKEQINRLPLFGVNKLKNMSDLSTDIFQTMTAYASMATHYAAMGVVVDTVEVGKEVLKDRQVGGLSNELDRTGGFSRAYTRYIKFLDKQVYGIGTKPLIIHGIVVNKILNSMSSLASKIFLGGNVAGGLVNLGTGINEIFKEAVSGEFFNAKDWAYASGYYFKHLPAMMMQMGKSMKDDEMSLIMRHFNILGDNKERQKQFSTVRERGLWQLPNFLYGESLLLPYTSGDHYMQSMSYLSILRGTRVYDENGKDYRLLDIYRKQAIEYTTTEGATSQSKKYGYTIKISDKYFTSRESLAEYNQLKDLLDTIENAPVGPFGPAISLTTEQQEYLDKKGWSIANLDSIKQLINREMQNIIWNEDNESALMDRAREINDRLHGIYNDQDKTMFHQRILGNMLLAMRGYALGMIARRFDKGKYSIALGGEVEGTYITLVKMLAASFTDKWGFGKTLQALFLPTKSVKAKMEKAGFSSNQYYNMRRNIAEIMIIGFLIMMKMFTAKPDNDDEEEEELKEYAKLLRQQGVPSEAVNAIIKEMKDRNSIDWKGVGYYFSSRLLREQLAWNYPIAMFDEWGQITSLIPAGASVVWEIGNLIYYAGGDLLFDFEEIDPSYYQMLKDAGYPKDFIDRIKAEDKARLAENSTNRFFYKNDGPDGIYHKGDPKWKRKFETIMPYYNYIGRTERVLYHPYQAEKAFEYGRQVRTR